MQPLQRVICLLQLAVHLSRAGTGDAARQRARLRLTEVLSSGKPSLLERLLSGASIDEFEICGTRGRLLAHNLGAGQLDVVADGTVTSHSLPAPEITHLGLVEHFVECLRTGRPNALPGEEGIQATRMTEAAYASAREGTLVRLK